AFLVQLMLAPQAGVSLSFVLSYMAMVGILVLGRAFGGIFRGVVPPFLLGPFALSIGAFIGTAGVVAWVFGDLRPAGIFAGLVVAPLTTVFMVGSMIWLGMDALFPALSPLFAWPLSLLYRLMEGTARLAGFLPGISASPYLVLLSALLLAALLVWFDIRLRARRNRLEPFA
ncbi:MAG: ComEC/Rec2 family competence protein, partial [Treponema sp.]|nr:ComEC/Rec2 family competence protein [Treponema sp.]